MPYQKVPMTVEDLIARLQELRVRHGSFIPVCVYEEGKDMLEWPDLLTADYAESEAGDSCIVLNLP